LRVRSDWRSVRLWQTRLERDLHREYDLRAHGLVIGSAILLLMWAVSHMQMRWGVDSLALRYLVTLGAGYAAYLLLLRWWAARLLQRNTRFDPDLDPGFGGGGSDGGSADGFGAHASSADAAGAHGPGADLPDMAGGALDAIGSADEGAVVVVPVLAIFLICCALVLGAGALVLLYFGYDALLAVAVELAFSYVTARVASRLAREGWIAAAVRLTWKPLLGSLLSAVLLGALVDHFLPQAHSLPGAVRLLLGR